MELLITTIDRTSLILNLSSGDIFRLPVSNNRGYAQYKNNLAFATSDNITIYDTDLTEKRIIPLNGHKLHDVFYLNDDLYTVSTEYNTIAKITKTGFNLGEFNLPTVKGDKNHYNCVDYPYITCFSVGNNHWRNTSKNGAIFNLLRNEYTLLGLNKPHNPLKIEYPYLFYLNSDNGEFCVLNLQTGNNAIIHKFNGFLRGLCHLGEYIFAIGVTSYHLNSPNRSKIAICDMRKTIDMIEIKSPSIYGLYYWGIKV